MDKFNKLFNIIMEDINSSKKDVILEFAPSKYKALNMDYIKRAAKSNKDFRGFWGNISANYNLTPEFVREYKDKLNWWTFSRNRKFPFTDEFLEEFKDYINWKEYCTTHKVSEQQYLKFRGYIKPAYFVYPIPLRQVRMKQEELEAFLDKYWDDTEEQQSGGQFMLGEMHTEREWILFWGYNHGEWSDDFYIRHAKTPGQKAIVANKLKWCRDPKRVKNAILS